MATVYRDCTTPPTLSMYPYALAFLTIYRPFGYLLFFLGMLIEGDAVLFSASFLAHQQFFEFPFVIFIGLAGALLGDSMWYFLGTKMNEHTPLFHKWLHRLSQPFDEHLKTRLFHTIFISKFTYGFHHALLARAGALRVPYKKFLKDDILATLPWFAIIVTLGFASSASFALIRNSLRSVQIGLVIGLILFFLIWHFGISNKLKKKI